MKKSKYLTLLSLPLLVLSFFVFPLNGAETKSIEIKKEVESKDQDMNKIAKAYGHMVKKSLETLGLNFDMKLVIQGIQDSMSGIESPMTEEEWLKAITLLHESVVQKQTLENLKLAEDFLKKNKQEKGVIELEGGKLQYLTIKEGTGTSVQEHFTPVIRYTGKLLDGKVFGQTREDEMLSLDDAIEGFRKGIVGMKEGEVRRLFIHPDLGYGTSPAFMPPNSLLTFDIEVIKASAPKAEDPTNSLSATSNGTDHMSEIATSQESSEKVR